VNRLSTTMEEFELQGRPRAAKNEAQEIPETKEKLDKSYPFRMTTAQHKRLMALAERDDRSVQYLLAKVVWPAIEELERRG